MWIVRYIRLNTHTYTHAHPLKNTLGHSFKSDTKRAKIEKEREKKSPRFQQYVVVVIFVCMEFIFFLHHFVSRPIRKSILRFGPWFHCYFAWHFFFHLSLFYFSSRADHTHIDVVSLCVYVVFFSLHLDLDVSSMLDNQRKKKCKVKLNIV